MTHEIVPLEDHHIRSVVESLTLAFMDDPLIAFMSPNESKREKISKWFWKSSLSIGMRWGVVETNPEGKGAAIWLPPGSTFLPAHRILRTSFAQAPFRMGLRGFLRFMNTAGPMEKTHKSQVPEDHWYLMVIGVHPDLQGSGLGTALLESGHAKADENNQRCYLETVTEYDVEFYSKRGYSKGDLIQLKGMPVTSMIRQGNFPN